MTEAKADILITGGRVMLPGGDPPQPATCHIRVRDGRIMAIEPGLGGPAAAPGATTRINPSGLLVRPGFVNAPYHFYNVLQKGFLEDMPLDV